MSHLDATTNLNDSINQDLIWNQFSSQQGEIFEILKTTDTLNSSISQVFYGYKLVHLLTKSYKAYYKHILYYTECNAAPQQATLNSTIFEVTHPVLWGKYL